MTNLAETELGFECLAECPKAPLSVIFRGSRCIDKRNSRSGCSLVAGDMRGQHLFDLVLFLVFFKEVLFQSV